jgi:shikimate dehydrogenase
MIPLAGVIGQPVSHSRSPALHGHWLKRYDIQGYYIPMEVAQADLAQVLGALPKMGFVGLNVTIPHKEAVLHLADIVSDRAALIGAANTLQFRKDGKLHADNTDGYRFLENLRQGAPGWQANAAPAAVFGAGGASRAIIASLLDAGCPEIRLSNRTKTRAESLRSEFGKRVEVVDWVQAGNMLDGAMTVVNTTSLGMVGKPDFRIPLDALSPRAIVTDLVYNPLETPFLAHAKRNGCTVIDGLGMLLHQAAPGFERWFGVKPEVDDDLRQAVLSA